MATSNGSIIVLEADPEWFDFRRFVTVKPKMRDGFRYIGADRMDDWSVMDLKTNKTILANLTGEDAGLYTDVLEIKHNAYHDHDAVRKAAAERQSDQGSEHE